MQLKEINLVSNLEGEDMREIKFRAWNGNQLVPWETIKVYGRDDFFERPDNLMQFTGLKDKNGKEIYEGDILEFMKEDDGFLGGESKVLRAVKWDTYYGACWNFGTANKDGEKRWSYPAPYEAEIIGNIYENPELIT